MRAALARCPRQQGAALGVLLVALVAAALLRVAKTLKGRVGSALRDFQNVL